MDSRSETEQQSLTRVPGLLSPGSGSRRSVVVLLALAGAASAIVGLAHLEQEVAQRRRHLREHCAYVRLREVVAAQAQFWADGRAAGAARYGFLSQLVDGISEQRGRMQDYACPCRNSAGIGGLGRVENGRACDDGYVYEVFLPAKGGGWASEVDVANGMELDALACQRDFLCYAWPLSVGATPARAFLVDARGDVLSAKNSRRRYIGDQAPIAGVTGFGGDSVHSALARNAEDAMGDRWVVW